MKLVLCCDCQEEKPRKEMVISAIRKRKDNMRVGRCKSCQSAKSKEHYRNNKLAYKQRGKARRIRKTKIISMVKVDSGGCSLCGITHLECLDFHHIDRKDKLLNISENGWFSSVKNLLKEIKKCAVLCSNCHRQIHSGRIDKNKVTAVKISDITLQNIRLIELST